MNRYWILLLFVAVLPGYITAQQQTEYNRKGDDAVKRQDYRSATMWYEEGLARCDSYSINQLTTVWKFNKKMRSSMRGLMSKCFDCLRDKATIESDSTAIKQLILYYEEGIGTLANEERAKSWNSRLEELRRPPLEQTAYVPPKAKKDREPMRFFAGYAFSPEAPYGLTVGGVGSRLGWYARFRTNFSFSGYANECKGNTELVSEVATSYHFTNKKKTNSYAATAGLVVKCTPWLLTTIGVGYGKRDLLCEYITHEDTDYTIQTAYWSKHMDYSHSGLAADLDVMVKRGIFFISAGCNTINFKYVDLNAGVGLFF